MKLRSISHSSKGLKTVLSERRASRSSSGGELFNMRASISSIGSMSRNAKLHRARDVALKKLHKIRANLSNQVTPYTPDSANASSDA